MKPEKKKRKKLWFVLIGAGALVFAGLAVYQMWFSQPSQQAIDSAVESQDWRRAVNLLERADLSEDAGENHFNMALAYTKLGNKSKARDAYMRADTKGYNRSLARYEIACLYAEEGETYLALEWLRDAFDSGFSNESMAKNDDRLKEINQSEEFQRILDPIRFDEGDVELGGLSFLLGTWKGTGNIRNASVTFTEVVKGMVIEESWVGTGTGGTQAVFVLDPETNRWSYSYMDGFGRLFRGDVQVRRRTVTINGTMTYTNGEEIVRKVDIKTDVDVIDYETSVSVDGGVTFMYPQRMRLNPAISTVKPSF